MAIYQGPVRGVRSINTGIGARAAPVTGGLLPHRPPAPEVAETDTEFYSDSAREAMRDDDVASNGVFDFDADGPTVHAGEGIFEDNPALPGYAARESGLGPSETIDRQTGRPVEVYLPGTRTTMNFLPSSQPRYPWPGSDPYVPDLSHLDDFGTVPTANTAFFPLEDGFSQVRRAPPTMSRGEGQGVQGLGGLGGPSLGFLDQLEGGLARIGLVGQIVVGAGVAIGLLWLYDNYLKPELGI